MKTKSIIQLTVLPCLLVYATSTQAFWEKIIDAVTNAAQGQATRFEQINQISNQLDMIETARDQLTYLIKNSEQYSGDNAWRAGVEIRVLERRLRDINANGRHISANSHDAAARMLAVLPTDAEFNAARTAAERSAYVIQQDVATRDALRDSLRATMNSSKAFHERMSNDASNVDTISKDLSRADSQLEALQLIGAAVTQNSQQLNTLTKALVAQTDLLMNVYAKELAAKDRHLGDGEQALRTKIVPSHLVDEYRRRGHDVKPAAIEGVLQGTR